MVEADPDVPHAFAHVVSELRASGCRLRQREALRGRLRPEHGGARAPGGVQAQQAAVLRVDVGEQAVVAASMPAGGARAVTRSGSTV